MLSDADLSDNDVHNGLAVGFIGTGACGLGVGFSGTGACGVGISVTCLS